MSHNRGVLKDSTNCQVSLVEGNGFRHWHCLANSPAHARPHRTPAPRKNNTSLWLHVRSWWLQCFCGVPILSLPTWGWDQMKTLWSQVCASDCKSPQAIATRCYQHPLRRALEKSALQGAQVAWTWKARPRTWSYHIQWFHRTQSRNDSSVTAVTVGSREGNPQTTSSTLLQSSQKCSWFWSWLWWHDHCLRLGWCAQ